MTVAVIPAIFCITQEGRDTSTKDEGSVSFNIESAFLGDLTRFGDDRNWAARDVPEVAVAILLEPVAHSEKTFDGAADRIHDPVQSA